jgi:hypothetical protein
LKRDTKEIAVHTTKIELTTTPSPVDVGVEFALKIALSCPHGCDLRGAPITITAPVGVIGPIEPTAFNDNAALADVVVTAPNQVGEYEWSIVCPRWEANGSIHDESSASCSVRTKPHMASIAVWDVPSPIVVDTPFSVKVGVKCSIGCSVAGGLVEVRDEDTSLLVGNACLTDTPWPASDSLYWATVEVAVPSGEGVHFWTAGFIPAESALTHQALPARFSGRVNRRPQHTLVVGVTAQRTGLPIHDAEVRAGAYAAYTNEHGVATIGLPPGTYSLRIRKDGYTASSQTVDVHEDALVQIEAFPGPSKAQVEAPVGPTHPYRD